MQQSFSQLKQLNQRRLQSAKPGSKIVSVVQDFENQDRKISEVSNLSKKFTAGKLKKGDIFFMNGTINQVYNLE
tara:strand:- start:459 stop:680 length:222 start_codon:yes stop_codon:yes gene_type:complete